MAEQPIDPVLRTWIRTRRLELRMTQKTLGEQVNLTEHMVSAIERGERRVTPHNLERFLEVLQATPEDRSRFMELSQQRVDSDSDSDSDRVADIIPSEVPLKKPRVLLLPWILVLLFCGIIIGLILAMVWWRYNTPTFQTVATLTTNLTGPFAWQHCINQPLDDHSRWDAGTSDDSACVFEGQTIALTAGMNTVLDENGVKPRTAPLLLRRIKGDFVARVKMNFDGGTDCCRHAGIGIRRVGDEQTWLRISKDSQAYHIHSQGLINGRRKEANISVDDRPVVHQRITYFELTRRGSSVTVSYSLDGQHWILYYEYQNLPLDEEVEVFLTVHADSGTTKLTALFSDFTVAPLP